MSSGGALLLVNYRNFVGRRIAFRDEYEAEQIADLISVMDERGCDLFFDRSSIGA